MKRIISFDIGIKNMAYCIFDTQVLGNCENQPFKILDRCENQPFKILDRCEIPFKVLDRCEIPFKVLDWGVLNLLPEKPSAILCNQSNIQNKEKGKKKIENFFIGSQPPENKCGKPAKYKNREQTFCEKHAKTSSYKKITVPSKLTSKTIPELQLLYDQITGSQKNEGPGKPTAKPSKKGLIEDIQRYVENHGLIPIKEKKTATSNTIDLISIGHSLNRLLTEVLDKVDNQKAITHVIIENQISPIANRMKTVQGMLAQFFIMKYGEACHIEFISSVNKLKIFEPSGSKKKNTENSEQETKQGEGGEGGGGGGRGGEAAVQNNSIGQSAPVLEGSQKSPEINPEYKKHKKDGIFYCRGILESNTWLQGHIESLNTKKKDDLADCFLQGIWYLVNKKRISVAENLKINSVIRV